MAKKNTNTVVKDNNERTTCLYTEKHRPDGKPLCDWTVYDADGKPIPVKTKDGRKAFRTEDMLTRGLCQSHYATVNKFRKAKGKDWKDIVKSGYALDAKEHGGRQGKYNEDADSIEGFLGVSD